MVIWRQTVMEKIMMIMKLIFTELTVRCIFKIQMSLDSSFILKEFVLLIGLGKIKPTRVERGQIRGYNILK